MYHRNVTQLSSKFKTKRVHLFRIIRLYTRSCIKEVWRWQDLSYKSHVCPGSCIVLLPRGACAFTPGAHGECAIVIYGRCGLMFFGNYFCCNPNNFKKQYQFSRAKRHTHDLGLPTCPLWQGLKSILWQGLGACSRFLGGKTNGFS